MRNLLAMAAPLLIAAAMLYAALQGVDLYEAMLEGARKGLAVMLEILPALLVLFPAVWLLRASGLAELLARLLAPALRLLGVPQETALLMLLRPISGSAALGVAAELIARHGPDSLTGRTAAVMIGSSETTLYVVSVYFAAAGVRGSRWAIPAALCADLACFLSSAWICRLFWG